MPIHDRIGRLASKGFDILGGIAGDVFGQVVQQIPGVLLGGIFGGPPTSRLPGPDQGPGGIGGFPGGGFGGFIPPQQQTFPGVPGPPLGGAVTFPQQEAPMAGFLRTALPGGAPIVQAGFGPLAGGLLGGLLGEGIGSQLFGGGQAMTPQGAVCPTLFVPARSALRAVRMFRITNPSTGADVWYRNAGRPILWSGDFAAVKRVRRVAGKARRKR